MRVERRIFRNTAVLAIGEIVGQLANFAFVVLLTRRFGIEILGWYSFAMALGAVLSPFVSLGGSTYLTRELARDPASASALFIAFRPIQLSSGLLVWLVMALTALAANVDTAVRLVIVVVGAYHVLLRMAALHLAPSAARERLVGTAVVGGGHRILVATLAATAIMLGFSAPVALLAMPVSAFLSLAAAWAYARRDLQAPSTVPCAVNRTDLIRASLPFLGTALLAAIYSRGGVLLLTGLRGEVATGLYAAADRLLVPIYMVTGTFITATFPALTRFASEPGRMRELSKRCLRLILLVTIPLAALLAIFAPDVTAIIFGRRADGAAPVLAMLAPLAVVRAVTSLWMGHCVAIGQEHRAALAKAWAVVAFFVAATFGIVALGPMGLAIAAVLAEVLLAWQLRRLLVGQEQSDPVWPAMRGVIVAAACAAVVAAWLPSLALPVRAMLVVGTMALATALFGGVHGHDLRFLVAILRVDGRPGAPRARTQPESDRADYVD